MPTARGRYRASAGGGEMLPADINVAAEALKRGANQQRVAHLGIGAAGVKLTGLASLAYRRPQPR